MNTMGASIKALFLTRFCPIILLSPFLMSCSTFGYLAQQLPGQIEILTHKIPIEDVIEDPQASPELKETLKLSQLARQYAIESVGLKKSRNYTEYKDLKRDYVLISVVASSKTKLEAKEWSFPFFGSFPYIGYFKVEDAKKEIEKQKKAGLDAYSRKVSAFSTLGWFRDAILNTMVDDPVSLSETIIHELVHTTVYHKDEGTFNENLASFVGIEGTIQFLESLDERDWSKKKAWIQLQKDRLKKQFLIARWVADVTRDLNALYNSNISDEEKLRDRTPIFDRYHKRWKAEINPHGISELNNAFIVSIGTYTDDYDKFKAKYEQLGSLKALIQWAKKNKEI